MTPEEQMDLWVSGQSVHNRDRQECCPDFSCCVPELLVSEEERVRFRDCPEDRDGMLMVFLGRAITNHTKDKKESAKSIYVTGIEDPWEKPCDTSET